MNLWELVPIIYKGAKITKFLNSTIAIDKYLQAISIFLGVGNLLSAVSFIPLMFHKRMPLQSGLETPRLNQLQFFMDYFSSICRQKNIFQPLSFQKGIKNIINFYKKFNLTQK